jgi:hypothetical protein
MLDAGTTGFTIIEKTFALTCALMGVPAKQIVAMPGLLTGISRRELSAAEMDEAPRSIRKLGNPHWRKASHTGVLCMDERALTVAQTLTSVLAEAEIHDDQRDRRGGTSANDLARLAKSAMRGLFITGIELNISPLKCKAPGRYVGDRFKRFGERLPLGGGRVYQVPSLVGDWFVMADPVIPNQIRRNKLHEKTVNARILACLREDAPASRIMWGPGAYAAKALKMPLREVEKGELKCAPKQVVQLAEVSRRLAKHVGIELKSGLFCVDASRVDDIVKQGLDIVSSGVVRLHNGPAHSRDVPRLCAEPLRALVTFMQDDWKVLA